MDERKKRYLAIALFLFTDILFRIACDDGSPPQNVHGVDLRPSKTFKLKNSGVLAPDALDYIIAVTVLATIGMKRKRRFWCALRSPGAWNQEALRNWKSMGGDWQLDDWEDDQYKLHLRMTKLAFWKLHSVMARHISRRTTPFRAPVSSHKRLAMTLYWLAHGSSFSTLSLLFGVAKSTSVAVVHDTVRELHLQLVPKAIKFPTGRRLRQVMREFKSLSGLPRCGGAIDGTFVKIIKPKGVFGDAYFCYKKYSSVLLLASCDASGIFTFVDAGRPGSMGDAAVYQTSKLFNFVERKTWLHIQERGAQRNIVQGTYIRPYLVGDAAFPLSPTLMKSYDKDNLENFEATFNHRLIRTRRVIEQAFGRLKGRFRILSRSSLNNPRFVAQVAIVCCALHNVCEMWRCPVHRRWTIKSALYHPGPNDQHNNQAMENGADVRNKLARHIHRVRPV